MEPRAPRPYPPKGTAAPYYVPQGPRRIITGLSFHDVRLNKSANAWKPGWNRKSLPADRESQETQDLLKKFRSTLNKLTPENFPQLIKQVLDLNIDTEERLKGVVDLVFEKAIDEPSFSVTYGNMCRCLAELKVPTTADPNTTVSFIKLLGSSCKKEFDKYKEDDVVFSLKRKELDSAASTDRDRLQVELQEAERISRRRSVGNVKFIGEIFKLNLVQTTNIQYCVKKMLENHQEKSLECLCTLLTTIGRDFEVAKPQMDAYFHQMQSIVREGQTSSRIRFMLEDVIELRLHNWVSRKPDKGPKTLEQIHWEAKIEEQEGQRKVQEKLLSKDTKRQPDNAPKLQQALSVAAPKALNRLTESGTELETVAHEPFVMPPAALQPQVSSPLQRYVMTTESDFKDPVLTLKLLESPAPEETGKDREQEGAVPQSVTLDKTKPGEKHVAAQHWTDKMMRQRMERILLDDISSEQQIFCVKTKVDKSPVRSSPYLRELMMAVCKAAKKQNTNCRVHAALLQNKLPVEVKYRISERERQWQTLDELQALTVTLDEPQDLLRIYFDCHCDEDVISEYAFCKYGIRKQPADLLGKGVALKSVTAFFTWLQEAESED